MLNITRYQALRKIVGAKKSIIGVRFVKVDGSMRVMAVRRNTLVKVKGDAASETAKAARVTRKKNHPYLVSVLELRKGISQWRTLNLRTLKTVRVDGETYKVA